MIRNGARRPSRIDHGPLAQASGGAVGDARRHPRAAARQLIASDRRFHTWALAARFLDAAAETHWQDTPARLAACFAGAPAIGSGP